MGRLCAICVLAAGMLAACSEEPKPEEIVSQAAKAYYDHLVAGRYDEYLAGVAGTDSLPAGYREQLLNNTKQFAALLREEHGGVCEVRVVNAVADTTRRQADVFLMLCFCDSTKEEIVVPMSGHGNEWRMR